MAGRKFGRAFGIEAARLVTDRGAGLDRAARDIVKKPAAFSMLSAT
jgi:hypothetical protein